MLLKRTGQPLGRDDSFDRLVLSGEEFQRSSPKPGNTRPPVPGGLRGRRSPRGCPTWESSECTDSRGESFRLPHGWTSLSTKREPDRSRRGR